MLEILNYQYLATTTAPPTGNQVRLNASVYLDVSQVWVRYVTNDGLDAYWLLMAIPAGTGLTLQDRNDHTIAWRFETTAIPVDVPADGYVTFAVTPLEATAPPALPANQQVAVAFIGQPGTLVPVGTGLVTYDTAANHLRLYDLKTDPETEATVTRMLAQAEALVLKHVTMPEPPWTSATDPAADPDFAIVQACVLTVLANLWRFRGDDEQTAAHPALSPRVAELLQQLTDTAFA